MPTPALIGLLACAAADVPTPPTGKVYIFLDVATNGVRFKDDAGGVSNLSAAALSALAALTPAADKIPYFTSSSAAALLTRDTDGTLAGNSDTNIATQKATKTYVDAKLAGLSWKQAVRAATTAAGTLASSFENGDTVDGVTLATGDRILIKNQATASENGIYTVNASGAPTRATDADSGAELVNASCYVSEGTANADTQWVCTTNATITVGSTSLAFAQLTSGGSLALTSLTDVNISSPSDGDVPTWNAATSKWLAAAPGGGGSGNGRWDPMALRAGQSASSQDDDWSGTGTTLNARWTGNANWPPTAFDIDTTAPKRLYIRAAGNSTAARAILQAIPAGDFVIQTVVMVGPNNANLSHAGLYLADGTGGSANIAEVSNYVNGNTGSGVQGAVQSGTAASITTNLVTPYTTALNPVVLRIERASGVYTAEFSPDGIIGYRFTFSPGFTPTHFGLGGAPFTGELRAGFNAFRYDATATTRWGAYL
jgi:hypothetical protein